jgi:hypothetical protein
MNRIGFVVGWDLPDRVDAKEILAIAEEGLLWPAKIWASNLVEQVTHKIVRATFSNSISSDEYFHKRVASAAKVWRYAVIRHVVVVDIPPKAEEQVVGYLTVDANHWVATLEDANGAIRSVPLPEIPPSAVSVAMAMFMREYLCPPLRKAGGVYFVRRDQAYLIDKLRVVTNRLGGRLTVFFVAGEPVEQESLLQPVQDMFSEMIQQLESQIQEVKKAKTLDALGTRIGRLIDEARVYADLLSLYSDDLRKMIGEAEKAIWQVLDERRRTLQASEILTGGATK